MKTIVNRAWLNAIGLIVLAAVVYFKAWRELWVIWGDTARTTYTHGTLIVLISLWLLWRARHRMGDEPLSPSWRWMPVVLVLSLLWLVAARAEILTAYTALWPVVCFAVLAAGTGWRIARHLAFPLAFLWFAMPLWDFVNGVLQHLTVLAVHLLSFVTRVPAEIRGSLVVLPNGRFEIASGCSGLHFFIVALAVSALAGEIHRDRPKTRLVLIGLAAAIALVSNWIRVYLIILAGYLTDMQHYLVRVDHYKFGWFVFALGMAGFFFMLRQLPAHQATPHPQAPGRAPGRPGLAGFVAAGAMAAVLPVASWLAWQVSGPADVSLGEGRQLQGFAGPLSPSPIWEPEFPGATAEQRVSYLAPGGEVIDYYANVYLAQHQGEELIGYGNELFARRVFTPTSRRSTFVEGTGGYLPVVEQRLESRGGHDWIGLYYYEVAGRRTANDLAAQLLSGFVTIWGPASSGIRAAAMPCGNDCGTAAGELAALLSEMARTER